MARLIFLSILALILNGCATTQGYIALTPEAQKNLPSAVARSGIWQDEMIIQSQAPGVSAALGGGLIGAVIDSSIAESRQSKVQNIIEPFYAAVDDFDFRQFFWSVMKPTLTENFPIKVDQFITSSVIQIQPTAGDGAAVISAGKAWLNMRTDYEFSHDFSRINIVTAIALYKPGETKPVYQNSLTYQSQSIGATEGAAVQAWSADKGLEFKKAVMEGIFQTAKMIKLDIANTTSSSTSSANLFSYPKPLLVNGPLLQQQDGRVIVRRDDGRVFSLPL